MIISALVAWRSRLAWVKTNESWHFKLRHSIEIQDDANALYYQVWFLVYTTCRNHSAFSLGSGATSIGSAIKPPLAPARRDRHWTPDHGMPGWRNSTKRHFHCVSHVQIERRRREQAWWEANYDVHEKVFPRQAKNDWPNINFRSPGYVACWARRPSCNRCGCLFTLVWTAI
jgi:hypothetical protein